MAHDTTPHGDTKTPTPAEPKPAQAAAGEPSSEQPKPAQSEPDWKSEARKHEDRSKEWKRKAEENEAAARRLKELEDAQKTEAEKYAERVAQLEKENNSYRQKEQVQAWAREVAKTTGVDAALLRGSTREELEAHAEQLKPVLKPADADPSPAPRPVPTVGQTPVTPGNVSLPEQIAAAEAAGNKQLVAALKAVQIGG